MNDFAEYPEDVQKYVYHLKDYKLNNSLSEFNILHLYPRSLAYPDGYWDSKFFDLVGYNYEIMEFRNIAERRDGLDFSNDVIISLIRIFADGSTLIRFKRKVKLNIYQSVEVEST